MQEMTQALTLSQRICLPRISASSLADFQCGEDLLLFPADFVLPRNLVFSGAWHSISRRSAWPLSNDDVVICAFNSLPPLQGWCLDSMLCSMQGHCLWSLPCLFYPPFCIRSSDLWACCFYLCAWQTTSKPPLLSADALIISSRHDSNFGLS